MIDGAALHTLRRIPDARGEVLHMLRADAPHFRRFGEVYFSRIVPGAVKAWKRHRLQTQAIAVPAGRVRFVLYDARPGSPTHGRVDVHDLGDENYALLVIPPGVWYGFQALGGAPGLVANCADLPHDPAESEKIEPDSPLVPYAWGEKA